MDISDKILDELLKDYKNPENLMGEKGIVMELKKYFLNTEPMEHLGYKKQTLCRKAQL